jgi:hypothetical protein
LYVWILTINFTPVFSFKKFNDFVLLIDNAETCLTSKIIHYFFPISISQEKTRGLNNSVLQGLVKSSCTEADTDKSSQDAESHDLSHDLPNNMATGLQEMLTTPSKEQCEGLAQLMQYLHNLVVSRYFIKKKYLWIFSARKWGLWGCVLASKRPLGIFQEDLRIIPIPDFCLVADISMIVTKGDAKLQTNNTYVTLQF